MLRNLRSNSPEKRREFCKYEDIFEYFVNRLFFFIPNLNLSKKLSIPFEVLFASAPKFGPKAPTQSQDYVGQWPARIEFISLTKQLCLVFV